MAKNSKEAVQDLGFIFLVRLPVYYPNSQVKQLHREVTDVGTKIGLCLLLQLRTWTA